MESLLNLTVSYLTGQILPHFICEMFIFFGELITRVTGRRLLREIFFLSILVRFQIQDLCDVRNYDTPDKVQPKFKCNYRLLLIT